MVAWWLLRELDMSHDAKHFESKLLEHWGFDGTKPLPLSAIDNNEEREMVLIGHYRIEWTEDASMDELFSEDGPIERFPKLCMEGDDITMSERHLAISRTMDDPEEKDGLH